MGGDQWAEVAILSGRRFESSVSIIVIGKGVWHSRCRVPSIAFYFNRI
jgi:hypothetical protein